MTKRIAIAELEGVALDWAVAKSVGVRIHMEPSPFGEDYFLIPDDNSDGSTIRLDHIFFDPSRDWRKCGPMITEYQIQLVPTSGGWTADAMCGTGHEDIGASSNPLIAACRAIVAAHNPDGFVEVPDELVEGE